MEQFEKAAILQKNQAIFDQCRDSNKAMIDFAKMTLCGVVLINCVAVIPIVYLAKNLHECILIFSIGALLGVVATGMAYLTQWAITGNYDSAFYTYVIEKNNDIAYTTMLEISRQYKKFIFACKAISMILAIASMFMFCVGLYKIWG